MNPVGLVLGRANRSAIFESGLRRLPPAAYLAPIRAIVRGLRHVNQHGWTDADPVALRWVDPSAIETEFLDDTPGLPACGRVVAGDWDQVDDRFMDRPVPRAIERHYCDGIPWNETCLSDEFREQIERFGNAWGYSDPARFHQRVREIEALHDSIDQQGYRTQRERLDGTNQKRIGGMPVPVLGEINVDIARNGAFIWRRFGQHRLAIARVLGIDSIPVLVVRRHRRWQSIRDRCREGIAPSPRYRDHPDLGDLSGERDG